MGDEAHVFDDFLAYILIDNLNALICNLEECMVRMLYPVAFIASVTCPVLDFEELKSWLLPFPVLTTCCNICSSVKPGK